MLFEKRYCNVMSPSCRITRTSQQDCIQQAPAHLSSSAYLLYELVIKFHQNYKVFTLQHPINTIQSTLIRKRKATFLYKLANSQNELCELFRVHCKGRT